nr:neuropeptide-like 4 [Leptinotarsa decemlineata]
MFKLFILVAIFAVAIANPAPEAKADPKASPDPSLFAAYTAPVVAAPVAYTSAYSAPLAYASYVAPSVYSAGYTAYSPYAGSYVVL